MTHTQRELGLDNNLWVTVLTSESHSREMVKRKVKFLKGNKIMFYGCANIILCLFHFVISVLFG